MTPANLKSVGHHKTPASFKTLRPIKDTKRLLTISEYGSVSRIRKTQTDICLHEDMFPSFNHEENGRHHHLGDEDMPVILLPSLDSRSLNKRSLKRLTALPCSKRPKAEQQNDSVMTAKIDDHDAKKVGYDHVRSISDGNSSDVVAAAAILCEMASSSNSLSSQNDTCERIEWPHSQNSTKEYKSAPRKRTGTLTLAPRHHDTFKRTLPSTKHKLISEKRTDHVHPHNVGSDSVRWSLSAEAGSTSPRKLERDCVRESKTCMEIHRCHQVECNHHCDMKRMPPGRMQSPLRHEKVYGNRPKLGKETLKASTVGFREL